MFPENKRRKNNIMAGEITQKNDQQNLTIGKYMHEQKQNQQAKNT